MTLVRVPPSAKLRIASCHIDFGLNGLGADSASMIPKIDRTDKVLRATRLRPHLVVFPEGALCDELLSIARRWAEELGATTVCGTSQMGRLVGGIVVRPNGPEEKFFKRHLSPYDHNGAADPLLEAMTAGIDLVLPCEAIDGQTVPANVRVLICYDFRYYHPEDHVFNTTQVLVVPMHDKKPAEPETIASGHAKRHYLRTLLVNKAVSDGAALPSSAFGPLPAPFAGELSRTGALGVDQSASRIWRTDIEGITIGEYEVGQSVALGHDTSYGAGFFYHVEHHPFGATTSEVVPMEKAGFCARLLQRLFRRSPSS